MIASAKDVEHARALLKEYLRPTRLVSAESLSSRSGARVYLKIESDLPTGTFKVRVPRGTWDVLVQPPSVLPPFRAPALDTAAAPVPFDISLPQPSALVASEGFLFAGGQPLPGASVTAVDGQGGPLSAATVSRRFCW